MCSCVCVCAHFNTLLLFLHAICTNLSNTEMKSLLVLCDTCTYSGGACKLFVRTFPPLGTSLCPGDSLTYMCTVSDTSSTVTTVWTGTAFQQCGIVSQHIAGQIGLTQRTPAGLNPMTPGVCGNLTAVTTNVSVSCYTSVLTVTSPQYVNGTTIACLGVGNDTLNVLMACEFNDQSAY